MPSGPNANSTTVTVTNAVGTRLGQIPVTLSTGITNNQPAATTYNQTVYRASHCATAFPSSYTLKFSFKD